MNSLLEKYSQPRYDPWWTTMAAVFFGVDALFMAWLLLH